MQCPWKSHKCISEHNCRISGVFYLSAPLPLPSATFFCPGRLPYAPSSSKLFFRLSSHQLQPLLHQLQPFCQITVFLLLLSQLSFYRVQFSSQQPPVAHSLKHPPSPPFLHQHVLFRFSFFTFITSPSSHTHAHRRSFGATLRPRRSSPSLPFITPSYPILPLLNFLVHEHFYLQTIDSRPLRASRATPPAHNHFSDMHALWPSL